MVEQPSPAETYAALRMQALEWKPPDGQEPGSVSGVVVDVPGQGGYTTVVAMIDGTTSLYTSGGGGLLGGGGRTEVAAASGALFKAATLFANLLTPAEETLHPRPGYARIFLLTPEGRRVADVSEDAFWGRQRHPLLPVIAGIQGVITALRTAAAPEDPNTGKRPFWRRGPG